jgi:hypothetical protein
VTVVSRNQLFEARAKQLGERFGLQVNPGEWWSTEGTALRTEKPIRMRVRRICHLCNTTFGVAKECPNCDHTRCKQCVRYPPKRTEEEKQASRERRAAKAKELAANPSIEVDWLINDKLDFKLTKPAKCGTQDLVYKKPRQRVRRNCHECGTQFTTGNKVCNSCQHVRCTDCPRDPYVSPPSFLTSPLLYNSGCTSFSAFSCLPPNYRAKKKKYPYGYPGDEFGPDAVPYFECEKCKTVFPADAADGTPCESCGTAKSDKCERIRPRRVDPEPDNEALKAVQEKLAALKVG